MSFLKFKTKKSKIVFLSTIIAIFVVSSGVAITLWLLSQITYTLADNPTFEINTEATLAALFSEVKSGTVQDPGALIDTSTIGEKSQQVTITSRLGTTDTIDIPYNVVDTTAPVITGDDSLSFRTDEDSDILSHYQAEDNSKKDVKLSIAGEYDTTKAGEYSINIVAKDESGNEATKTITLNITAPPQAPARVATSSNRLPYYIEVNRQQNVVIVYSLGQNGNYSNIAKVFVSSTGAPGSETPLGTFTTSDRYEALYLVGNVWGHYTVRISGPYFFHSVPYFSKGNPSWDNLEYLEYNKLGNGASAGCVRLSAIDAKWIYDNISPGTTVKIYDSDTLPAGVSKPTPIKIDENDAKRGWDPTDPDPNNPWH